MSTCETKTRRRWERRNVSFILPLCLMRESCGEWRSINSTWFKVQRKAASQEFSVACSCGWSARESPCLLWWELLSLWLALPLERGECVPNSLLNGLSSWPQMTSDQKEQLQSVVFYTLNINIKYHQSLNVSSLWLLTGQLKITRKGWVSLSVTSHTAWPNKPVISWSSLVHSSAANPYPQLVSLLPIVLSGWPPWSVWLNREWVSWFLGSGWITNTSSKSHEPRRWVLHYIAWI